MSGSYQRPHLVAEWVDHFMACRICREPGTSQARPRAHLCERGIEKLDAWLDEGLATTQTRPREGVPMFSLRPGTVQWFEGETLVMDFDGDGPPSIAARS